MEKISEVTEMSSDKIHEIHVIGYKLLHCAQRYLTKPVGAYGHSLSSQIFNQT